ncbi:MAG: DUF86 domain-containing protein [Pseudomonadales bacterium]
MDQMILAEKLESLRRCIKRIADKKPRLIDSLIIDPDIQDILVLNLTRAIELCVDIGSHIISGSEATVPQTMGDVFTILQQLNAISAQTSQQLKKAVGFRNIAMHNYGTINWEIVYAICDKSLEDFRTFAKEISHYTANPNGTDLRPNN